MSENGTSWEDELQQAGPEHVRAAIWNQTPRLMCCSNRNIHPNRSTLSWDLATGVTYFDLHLSDTELYTGHDLALHGTPVAGELPSWMPVLAAGTDPQMTPSSVRPLLLSAIMITLPGTSACAAALLFITLSCRARHHISLRSVNANGLYKLLPGAVNA